MKKKMFFTAFVFAISLSFMSLPLVGQTTDHETVFFDFLKSEYNKKNNKLQGYLIEEFNLYAELYPYGENTAEALLLAGRLCDTKNDRQAALAYYAKCALLFPESESRGQSVTLATVIIEKEKNYEGMRVDLKTRIQEETVGKSMPEKYFSFLEFLSTLNDKKAAERALAEFRYFERNFPENEHLDQVLNWMGGVYQQAKMPDQAVASYTKIEALYPRSDFIPEIRYKKGVVLYQDLNEPQQAVAVLDKVLSESMGSQYIAPSLYTMGEIKYKKLKDHRSADAALRQMVDNYPTHDHAVDALFLMAEVREKGLKDNTAAIAAYDEVVENYSENSRGVEALDNAANIMKNKNKDYAGAAAYYARIAERFPAYEKSPDKLMEAGKLCEDKLKDAQKAIDYYEMVVEKYPGHKKAQEANKRIMKVRDKTK